MIHFLSNIFSALKSIGTAPAKTKFKLAPCKADFHRAPRRVGRGNQKGQPNRWVRGMDPCKSISDLLLTKRALRREIFLAEKAARIANA